MGSAYTIWVAQCYHAKYPAATSAFASQSTGLKVKGDGLHFPPDNYNPSYQWGECPTCQVLFYAAGRMPSQMHTCSHLSVPQYFPAPVSKTDGLKACVVDQTGCGPTSTARPVPCISAPCALPPMAELARAWISAQRQRLLQELARAGPRVEGGGHGDRLEVHVGRPLPDRILLVDRHLPRRRHRTPPRQVLLGRAEPADRRPAPAAVAAGRRAPRHQGPRQLPGAEPRAVPALTISVWF